MRRADFKLMLAAALVTGAFVSPLCATAATITFETAAPGGPGFTGPITEDGFTYSTKSGNLYVNLFTGNPGRDIEGTNVLGGGVLKVVSAIAGGTFQFVGIDFSVFNFDMSVHSLTVEGLLSGGVVATDIYSLAGTAILNPDLSYSNWTTEAASALSGVTIDELDITLVGGAPAGGSVFNGNVDNIVLAAIPEPGSVVLLGLGLAGLGVSRRKRN